MSRQNSTYEYVTDCVAAIGDDICEMMDLSSDLSNISFLKLARTYGFDKLMLDQLGYSSDAAPVSFFLKDWGVRCHRGRYQGLECLFVRHSGIEHVFMDRNLAAQVLSESDAVARQARRAELIQGWDERDVTVPVADQLSAFWRSHGDELVRLRIPLRGLIAWNDVANKVADKFERKQMQGASLSATLNL